jgi:hypothetical protein
VVCQLASETESYGRDHEVASTAAKFISIHESHLGHVILQPRYHCVLPGRRENRVPPLSSKLHLRAPGATAGASSAPTSSLGDPPRPRSCVLPRYLRTNRLWRACGLSRTAGMPTGPRVHAACTQASHDSLTEHWPVRGTRTRLPSIDSIDAILRSTILPAPVPLLVH